MELQGTTLKLSSGNLKGSNLKKLAISVKLDLQYCPLGYDQFIKRYTRSPWSTMSCAVIGQICRTVPAMPHPCEVIVYILRTNSL